MKNKFLIAGLATCAMAWAAKDPVIMTINGEDVTKSEFEYLYNKNSQQQITRQTLDEYAEMFKIYKLKVADAVSEGIDTTSMFKNEFMGYRSELAAPYLVDSVYVKRLMREAYDRMGEDVEVSHILFFMTRDMKENNKLYNKADSIRKELMKGADFEEMARKYSQDRSVSVNGGYMGYITSMLYPYSFESAAYNLKEGEISEVIKSSVGYHIIKVGKKRNSRGQVHVQHILKLVPQVATPEEEGMVKNKIDSLYDLVAAGADFSKLATTNSDDKNSARQGGEMPWFGTGMMVAEFDSVAFALKVGEVSKPVRTPYGYHIIKKLGEKDIAPYEELKSTIETRISNPKDERYKKVREHMANKLEKEYKGKENKSLLKRLRAEISVTGIDSAFHAKYVDGDEVLYAYADQSKTIGDMMKRIPRYKNSDPVIALEFFDAYVEKFKDDVIMEYEDTQLERKYSDFRNLVNEYRDGMLLFEVSNRKVWDKAAKDTEGLQKFFEERKGEYKWNTPHVKGVFVQAKNDSVAEVVKKRMSELAADTLVKTIREEFGKEVRIDKVLISKGENAMIDHLVFGGSQLTPANSLYQAYFLYDFKVLNEPEDVNDVKGQAISDYQNMLEQEWIEELKVKYPIVVNEKELKKIK